MARSPVLFAPAVALGLPAGAAAQSLPSTVDPGKVEERFRERPQPSLPEDAVRVPAQRPSDEAARGVSFRLERLLITGAAAPPGDLGELYDDMLGRRVTLLDLYELADAITARYRQAGNADAVASVPAQTIAGGVAVIRVVE